MFLLYTVRRESALEASFRGKRLLSKINISTLTFPHELNMSIIVMFTFRNQSREAWIRPGGSYCASCSVYFNSIFRLNKYSIEFQWNSQASIKLKYTAAKSSSQFTALFVKNTLSNNVIKKCFYSNSNNSRRQPWPRSWWEPRLGSSFFSDVLRVQLGDKCDHCSNLWWECDVFIGHQLGYKEGALDISWVGSTKLKAQETHWTRS